MMMQLRRPFLSGILELGFTVDGGDDYEDIGFGVRKWTETVVIFLTRSIEEA
jgi:hypothetical protein